MNDAPTLTELLHREHLHTLSVLNDLETRVIGNRSRPIDVANPQDRFRLEEFIRMVDTALLRHYRFEEEMLFPRLSEVGLGPMADMLTPEHDAVRGIVEGLSAIAREALANGFSMTAWNQFRDGIMDLVHSVSFHIQKEEMGLVRQLDMVLGPAADRELGRLYAAYA